MLGVQILNFKRWETKTKYLQNFSLKPNTYSMFKTKMVQIKKKKRKW